MDKRRILGRSIAANSLAASILAACHGGGSSAIPGGSVPAGSRTSPQGAARAALAIILSDQRVVNAHARTPQYVNEATDYISVAVNGSSLASFNVSQANTVAAGQSFTATQSQPCQYLNMSTSVRQCTLNVSAAPGTDTFLVFASGGASCVSSGSGCSVLSVGVTTAPITAGASNSVSITMDPVLAANANTIQVGVSASFASTTSSCNDVNACLLIAVDGNNPSAASYWPTVQSGFANLGLISASAYDALGLIPAAVPDSTPGDYANNNNPGTVANLTPFAVAPSSFAVTALTSSQFYIGGPAEFNKVSGPTHVVIAADTSAGVPGACGGSTVGYSAATSGYGTNGTPSFFAPVGSLCYDSAAPFNGDTAQYYAAFAALANPPVVPCSGSACPTILEHVYVAPMLVSTGNCVSDVCSVQVAEYDPYGITGYVNATMNACPADWTLQGNGSAISGSSGGTATATANADGYGYAQFTLTYSNSGETCVVTYQYSGSQGTFSAFSGMTALTVTRSYSTPNGTLSVVF